MYVESGTGQTKIKVPGSRRRNRNSDNKIHSIIPHCPAKNSLDSSFSFFFPSSFANLCLVTSCRYNTFSSTSRSRTVGIRSSTGSLYAGRSTESCCTSSEGESGKVEIGGRREGAIERRKGKEKKARGRGTGSERSCRDDEEDGGGRARRYGFFALDIVKIAFSSSLFASPLDSI